MQTNAFELREKRRTSKSIK
jgi:hypothetical protein